METSTLQALQVDKLVLDEENPRFFHLRHKGVLTPESIRNEILDNDDDIPLLTKSIQKSGVKDPIWVVKRKDGKYTVIEGNRRTAVLQRLMNDGVAPPAKVRFDIVSAHVFSSDTPAVDLILQKARLQSGKKEWGAFNEAALTYLLRQPPYLMAIEDIAVDLKISIKDVKDRIENFKDFQDFIKSTNDDNPKRFAYFAQCPASVKNWYKESEANRNHYFKLISPSGGAFHKIKSVATRGGLRDFAQVIGDPEALRLLLNDAHTSVEDALEVVRDNNITKGMPFTKKIGPLAMSLRSLNEEQLEKLRVESRFRVELKSLMAACAEVIKKIE